LDGGRTPRAKADHDRSRSRRWRFSASSRASRKR
jgi:hypothetical protein